MIKIDSASLIYLVKLDLFEYLTRLDPKIAISPEVKVEVVDQGKQNNYADAFVVESLLNHNKILIHNLPQNYILPSIKKMHSGELEVIHCAYEEKCKVIIDDVQAQRYAATLGILFRTVPFLLVELLEQEIITSAEFETFLQRMISLMNLAPKEILYLQKCKELLR